MPGTLDLVGQLGDAARMPSSESRVVLAILGLVALSVACGANQPAATAAPDAGMTREPVQALRPAFCEREDDDAVRRLFCDAEPPEITSLAELQQRLGVTPGAPASQAQRPVYHGLDSAAGSGGEGENVTRYYVRYPVLLGHSTALSGHLVSPLNPRAILLGLGTALAFQRGVYQVELASLSNQRKEFNLYLLRFRRACGDERQGCSRAELYTQRIERDWTAVEISDAEQLQNTPDDCLPCHKRGRDTTSLMMREFERPWTHIFEPYDPDDPNSIPLGRRELPGVQAVDLMRDYREARLDEPYANVDVAHFPEATPSVLQTVTGRQQPLFFDAATILKERYSTADGAPQTSPTWESAYAAFKRGEQLALPYLETRPTDPDKQAALADAYQRHAKGELSDDELPDLSDIFPDDPQLRARIGLSTEPDASAQEALIQACGSCHNDVLDQHLTRARFNIDVSRLGSEELDHAIERIGRDRAAPGAMPPVGARQLHPDARDRVLEYLRGAARSGEPDAALVHAAEQGMLGGGRAAPF
jgi:hypothetical protein